MNHHLVAGIEWQQQVLPAAVGGDDRGAGQTVNHGLTRRAPNRPFASDFDTIDAAANYKPLKTAANRLNLR